jgi:endoglucanase
MQVATTTKAVSTVAKSVVTTTSSTGITTTTTYNSNGTIQSIHYAGITGQAYDNYTAVYGANNKPVSWTYYKGTTVVETADYNASGQYETHFFGITGEPYTSYTVIYNSAGRAVGETFSNGMAESFSYNSNGSLHEVVTTGITGQPYASSDLIYGSNNKPVSETFSNGTAETWPSISSGTINGNVVTLTGIAPAGSTIGIFSGSTQIGSATASSSGAWTYTSGQLANGSYALAAKTISGTNVTAVSSDFKFTLSAAPKLTPVANQTYQATSLNGAVATFAVTASDVTDKTDPVVFREGNTVVASGNTFSLGTHTITASATDSKGYTSSETFTITVDDTTAPKVAAVTASPTNGDEDAGKTIDFTLEMSEAVTVAGSPSLTLNDGGIASYVSGSGTNALTFSYTVGAGQNTSALAITGVNLPNNAAITDLFGTATNLAGAQTTFSGLQIDTTAPAAPVISGDIVMGDTVQLNGTAEASSTVTVFNGTTAIGTAAVSVGGTWSLTTGALSSGTYTFTATATDAAGNTSALSQGVDPTIAPAGALLGVDLIGAEFGVTATSFSNTSYTFPTEAELEYFKAQGMTLVRLPISWERLQPTLNGALDPSYLGQLETFMNQAQALGIQVAVDLHNFGRYNGQVIGSAAVPISAFANVWTQLATALKGYTNIYGYDLMNEPHDMGSPTVWPAAAQAAVNAIRTVDMTHAVIVEGDDWASANSWLQYNSNLNITDPANNVIYEAHAYFDANHSGTYTQTYEQQGANPNIGEQVLAPFETWLTEHNYKGYIGEFGAPGNDPNWLTVLNNFEKTLQQDGIAGTYWAAGPWWQGSLDSVEPINGQDRSQIADLVANGEHNSTNPPVITYNADGSIHDIAYSNLSGLSVFGEAYTAYDSVYGANGQVASETFNNGVSEAFTYYTDGLTETATYSGLTGQQVDGDSYTSYETVYNVSNQVASETYSNGIVDTTTYDSAGGIYEDLTTGITGQGYTSTDTIYGTNGKALTETWKNGTALVKVVNWNSDASLQEVITYNADGSWQDTLYGPNSEPTTSTFSTGEVMTWTYNSNGTLNEVQATGIVGSSYTSYVTFYNANSASQAVVKELYFPTGAGALQGYINQLTVTNTATGETVTTADGQTFNFAKSSASTLLVGNGTDENFVIGDESGAVTISGFVPNALSTTNHDTVTFGASAFTGLSDLLSNTTQSGANAIITDHFGDAVTLQNVQKSNLTASDFAFTPATTQSAALLAQYIASISPTTSVSGGTMGPTTTTQNTTTLATAH